MIRNRLIALLMGSTISAFGAWNTYHGASDLRGVSEDTLPEKPELVWRYNAGGSVLNTPVSDGKHIFFHSKKGRIIALDLKGAKVWDKQLTRTNNAGVEMPVRFEAPLVCGDGLVFAGSTKGTTYALDAKTGAVRWKYETGGVIIGSPNLMQCGIDDDRKDAKAQRKGNLSDLASSRSTLVLLDQSEGALHCVDPATGKRLWKTEGVERCDGAPGLGDGRIVFGSCLAALHVYSYEGKHLKNIEVGGDGQIAGGVAIADSLAFAGLRDGILICADLEKGDIVWSSDESRDETFSTPAVTSNKVVYSSDNGFVYAVNRKDGALLWKYNTEGLPTSPVVAHDKVVVSVDGALILLRLNDGRNVWTKEVSDEITSPAMTSGMVVVGADDGTMSAFGTKE